MRFVVRMEVMIEAPTEAKAIEDAALISAGIGNPLLKRFLEAQGVKVVAHRVDPKPTKTG